MYKKKNQDHDLSLQGPLVGSPCLVPNPTADPALVRGWELECQPDAWMIPRLASIVALKMIMELMLIHMKMGHFRHIVKLAKVRRCASLYEVCLEKVLGSQKLVTMSTSMLATMSSSVSATMSTSISMSSRRFVRS